MLSGWTENDTIIIAHQVYQQQPKPGAVISKCELCLHDIYVFPISLEKSKQKGWHLICHECVPEVQEMSALQFRGRIRDGKEEEFA